MSGRTRLASFMVCSIVCYDVILHVVSCNVCLYITSARHHLAANCFLVTAICFVFGINVINNVPFMSYYTDKIVCLIYIEELETRYENTPMQYTENLLVVKMKNFTGKILIFFLFLLKT